MIIMWSYARAFNKNLTLKYTAIWIFIVPILYKNKDFIEQRIPDFLDFPFSLKMSFLSASSIFIGSLIYHIRCPKVIKEYDNFNSFQQSGRPISDAVDIFKETLCLKSNKKMNCFYKDRKINKFDFEAITYLDSEKTEAYLRNHLESDFAISTDNGIREAQYFFKWGYEYHQYQRVIALNFCLFFYFTGIVLLNIIVAQNIYYVMMNMSF